MITVLSSMRQITLFKFSVNNCALDFYITKKNKRIAGRYKKSAKVRKNLISQRLCAYYNDIV